MPSPTSSAHLTDETLAIVLAGGRGTRLGALTRGSAKPALPFGAAHRIVDYSLSNCVNSGIRRIGVPTQYQSHTLLRHVHRLWAMQCQGHDEFIEAWPAHQGEDDAWYGGTADAVRQNLSSIMRMDKPPKHVLVLAGDHVYAMDYRPLLQSHVQSGAEVTIVCTEVPLTIANRFGVVDVDNDQRIVSFTEKPRSPSPMPGKPNRARVSMGIYLFDIESLVTALTRKPTTAISDFGHDVIPDAIDRFRVHAFIFLNDADTPGFWRDVGTLDAYYEANMALLDPHTMRELYRPDWPITTLPGAYPARFERDPEGREGGAINSIVGPGCCITGSRVSDSILFRGTQVDSASLVERSVLMPNVKVGAECWIQDAIVEEGCRVPPGTVIDAANSRFEVTPEGICLVTQSSLETLPRSTRPLAVPMRCNRTRAEAG